MAIEKRQVGPFKLLERLGAGGMGAVYLGEHEENGKRVAVKLLSSKLSGSKRAVARFNRELDILMKLRHSNIIRCFGGGRYQGQHFLVMELVKGGSLAAMLKRRGRLPWETVVDFALQICTALEYAHDQGIVHRDLTPGNLLIGDNEVIKIADFGLARVTFGERLTATRHTLGTVAYMSPEQIRGSKHTSHKTDLYALGCVMFEMLTGRLPFAAESTAEMLYQHMEEEPPQVSTMALDCPVWLDNLIRQLLAKDPEDRPQDAAAVSRQLREIKQRVAEGGSMTTAATEGGPSTLRTHADTADIKKLIGQRRKKKPTDSAPFYERVWFLAACLTMVAGLAVWGLWPASEERLFAEASRLMSDSEASPNAREKVLDELESRFPDGRHAAEVREFRDTLAAEEADFRARNHERTGVPPKSPGEAQYRDALDCERLGDTLSAHKAYEDLVVIYQDEVAERPFVTLAKRRMEELGDNIDELTEKTIAALNGKLDEADKLYEEGQAKDSRKVSQAVDIWESVLRISKNNETLGAQVERAQRELDRHEKAKSRGDKKAESAEDSNANSP